MVQTKSNFLLTSIFCFGTLATTILGNIQASNAFTWSIEANAGGAPITGKFTIEDENATPTIVMSSAQIYVSGVLSFTQNDFDSYTTVGNVPGADIQNLTWFNTTTFAQLALNFNPPLYTTLNPRFAYNLGPGSFYDDGNGAVNSVSGIVRAAPFEFSTTPGLIAFGLLTGGKYLYDQKKKKKHCQDLEVELEKTTP